MRILISAYACEPDKGSEPFLGWRWSNEIAKHNEVWVITRTNNRDAIERYLAEKPNENFHFVYVDVDGLIGKYKKGQRGIQVYYYFWQKQAYKKAKELMNDIEFDIVHHLTFGAFTQPTFMYKLGIPFIWGPLGGGEKLPYIQGRRIDLKSTIYEIARIVQMYVYRALPCTRGALKGASKILVTTEDTLKLIPRKYHEKTEIFQSLGIDDDFISETDEPKEKDEKIRVLMVGRMISWKGFDLGIEAFVKAAKRNSNIELYLRGNGELKKQLFAQVGELMNQRVHYVDTFFPYGEMHQFYKGFDIFLNCSLHDSGCLALLEAMSAGLPIVCVDTGGPHVITNDDNAIKIKPTDKELLTDKLCEALLQLCEDENRRVEMGKESKRIIKDEYRYDRKYNHLKEIYEEVVGTISR